MINSLCKFLQKKFFGPVSNVFFQYVPTCTARNISDHKHKQYSTGYHVLGNKASVDAFEVNDSLRLSKR